MCEIAMVPRNQVCLTTGLISSNLVNSNDTKLFLITPL